MHSEKKHTRPTEITEATVAETSQHKGSKDLTVLSREEVESRGITYPPSNKDTRADNYAQGCLAYFKNMILCRTNVETSSGAQRAFEVRQGKQKTTDTQPAPREYLDIESTTGRELLLDAQINIWNGHLREEDVANLMRTGRIARSEAIPNKGTTQPEKITLDSGIVGVFKATSKDNGAISHQSEIAAYQIDRLLGLRMVPLTVKCEKGSLQLWVNGLKSFPNTSTNEKVPNNINFFDYLINQKDRTISNNWGYTSNRDPVIYDHATAFDSQQAPKHLFIHDIASFIPDKHILDNARKLNLTMLRNVDSLSTKQKGELLKRRNTLIRLIDRHQP